MPTPSSSIKRYALIFGAVWTILVVCSFVWTYNQQKATVLEIARSEARIALQKDTLYRKWASKHGGVFVPMTKETPPNPYLPETLERNIITPSGKALTLVNPAYMTRQVFELASEGNNLVNGHLTSLKPIRRENEPDLWERNALSAFEKGTKEVSEVLFLKGQQYLRLMRPFIVEQPCLKCHAAQGYKLGDIRGGISVSVPMAVFSARSNTIITGTAATHGLIWVLGIGMIGFASRRLYNNEVTLRVKNTLLAEEITERQMAQDQLQEQAALLEEEIGERQMAQEALQEQAVMLEEEISERTQAEAATSQSEEKFSKSFRRAPLIMAITNIDDGTFLDINDKFVELSGYSREEIIGRTSLELGWISEADRNYIIEEWQRHGRVADMELNVRTKDGRQLATRYYGESFPMDGNTRLLSVCIDVTEQRTVEAQLLHAQKMEAIGTLAGGMAHDFNNILTVIAGYASLLAMHLESGSREAGMAGEISASVDRASEMTRSLLAFSRKEPLKMMPEDLNRTISALEKTLRRLIREDIDFRCALTEDPTPVIADKGQLEQVLINLVVNARDAMPHGGTLSITSSIKEVNDGEIWQGAEILPGEYCVITVSDTGLGMNRDTLERIFEPFFTTKETNKGTGLGLSIVNGIITKHSGKICVSSEEGHGTTFSIYLPIQHQSQKGERLPELQGKTTPKGNETVLLVDDDAQVRKIVTSYLEISGYTVLATENGESALTMFKDHPEKIHILITDIIMPKKNGLELHKEISSIHGIIPTIFISGYSAEIMEDATFPQGNVAFLSKPLKPATLLNEIRQLLDISEGRKSGQSDE